MGPGYFDLSEALIWPAPMACCHINTAADTLFYDVGVLWLRPYTRGISLTTRMEQPEAAISHGLETVAAAADVQNLSASANPEGVILVVDARRPSFVSKTTMYRNSWTPLDLPGAPAVKYRVRSVL